MEKILTLLILTATSFTLYSCESKDAIDGDVSYGFPSIVDTYFIPSAVTTRLCAVSNSTVNMIKQGDKTEYYDIDTTFQGTYLVMDCRWEDKAFSFDSETQNDRDVFERYAKSFGDTIFSNMHVHQCLASVMPLVAIEITADRQFDETHAAGSSLRDLIDFYMWRDFKTVISNYRETREIDYGHEELVRNLGSVSEDNPIYMLNDWFRLHFKKPPATPGTYKFTICMKFGEDPLTGETVEIKPVSVEIEFPK